MYVRAAQKVDGGCPGGPTVPPLLPADKTAIGKLGRVLIHVARPLFSIFGIDVHLAWGARRGASDGAPAVSAGGVCLNPLPRAPAISVRIPGAVSSWVQHREPGSAVWHGKVLGGDQRRCTKRSRHLRNLDVSPKCVEVARAAGAGCDSRRNAGGPFPGGWTCTASGCHPK